MLKQLYINLLWLLIQQNITEPKTVMGHTQFVSHATISDEW
jgi:hypothetical protein